MHVGKPASSSLDREGEERTGALPPLSLYLLCIAPLPPHMAYRKHSPICFRSMEERGCTFLSGKEGDSSPLPTWCFISTGREMQFGATVFSSLSWAAGGGRGLPLSQSYFSFPSASWKRIRVPNRMAAGENSGQEGLGAVCSLLLHSTISGHFMARLGPAKGCWENEMAAVEFSPPNSLEKSYNKKNEANVGDGK